MSEQELALGQREIVDGIEFTEAELKLMADSNVTPEECVEFVKNGSVQTINAAIGGVVTIKAGGGQERNEPFNAPEAPPIPAEPTPEAPETAPDAGSEPEAPSEPTGEAPSGSEAT